MKSNLLILLSASLLFSFEMKYDISLSYIYDSNVAQNSSIISDWYFVPELQLEVTPFTKSNFFICGELTYDAYIEKRDIDDNSPLITAGVGTRVEKGDFYWQPDFSGSQYVGMNVYLSDNLDESRDWISTGRSLSQGNRLNFKSGNSTTRMNITFELFDYPDKMTDTGSVKNDEDALTFSLEPLYRYSFDSEKKISISSMYTAAHYEGSWARTLDESFDLWGAEIGADIALWKSDFSLSVEVLRKKTRVPLEDSHTGEMRSVHTDYLKCTPTWSMNLVSDLNLKLGAKLRYRNSNDLQKKYDRHTAFMQLSWNSKIKKK